MIANIRLRSVVGIYYELMDICNTQVDSSVKVDFLPSQEDTTRTPQEEVGSGEMPPAR